MTTTRRITPAGITALAAFVHTDLRPDWDRRGIAAALHALADIAPADALAIAFARGATDPANDTPAAIGHLNNRSWDSDWYTPCRRHPEQRTRTDAGECASCRADRIAAQPSAFPQRDPSPPAKPLRQLVADTRRATPGAATGERSPAEEPMEATP